MNHRLLPLVRRIIIIYDASPRSVLGMGHPEGRFIHEFGNEQESRMTPVEGALYMGARNTFMVLAGSSVNWRQYNKSFVTLNNVG